MCSLLIRHELNDQTEQLMLFVYFSHDHLFTIGYETRHRLKAEGDFFSHPIFLASTSLFYTFLYTCFFITVS